MEKCKNATGQRLKIEMYVSANQRQGNRRMTASEAPLAGVRVDRRVMHDNFKDVE